MRVTVIAGTRPEGIKVAPLVLALRHARHEAVLVATGQHREMLDQVLAAFELRPDVDLGLEHRGGGLAELTAETVQRVDTLLAGGPTGALVVQGDTTAAFAGALAGFYRSVPVAHLEAGLRTGDLARPWPEEANRQLIARVAALHLAPSARSVANLVAEGVTGRIVQCGNTVIDALRLVRGAGRPWQTERLAALDGDGRPVVLATLHRRESWGAGLQGVATALERLARRCPGVLIVLPLHLNPVVRADVLPRVRGLENVVVTEPLPYSDVVRVLDRSRLVITDSGGLQEEAPALGTPVIVCRDTTERPEAVEAGVARLVGTDPDVIEEVAITLLTDDRAHRAMVGAHNPYGDGHAAERCVQALVELTGH